MKVSVCVCVCVCVYMLVGRGGDGGMAYSSHLCLYHVDASGAQGFDTVIDVHHALSLRHVQHDVNHDVTSCTSSPSAEQKQRQRELHSYNIQYLLK